MSPPPSTPPPVFKPFSFYNSSTHLTSSIHQDFALEATDLYFLAYLSIQWRPVCPGTHHGVLDVQPALVVVQGVQPEHGVVLALLLQEVEVLLAPVEHVPACLPGVGGHLDPQVLFPLAGVTVNVVYNI